MNLRVGPDRSKLITENVERGGGRFTALSVFVDRTHDLAGRVVPESNITARI